MTILILNGPNLNLLGHREPDIYGHGTLEDLEARLRAAFPDITFECFQSNHEGGLIDRLQQAHAQKIDGIVFNPGAFTHTSVALRDAIAAIDPPLVEVHLSNIYARERFRHSSYVSPVCIGQICGLGRTGYFLAVQYLTGADR